jgi:regulator of sirC expression with transglutaminase-like and TPR domain
MTQLNITQHNAHNTGEWRDALPVVEQSIQIDPNYQYAFGYRGLLKHTLGWPRLALDDLMAATNAQEKVDNVVAALAGVCHTCLGKYRRSTCVWYSGMRPYHSK